jgi:hypothetical protein
MTIPTQGPVKFSDLQSTFGGTNPISMSEYYRGGVNVPVGTNTDGIPASGAIDVAAFRGTTPFASVYYEVIGAGGAGGYGRANGYGSGRAASGGGSSITGSGVSISVSGGIGGLNAVIDGDTVGRGSDGQGTAYGSGGAGASNFAVGGHAPSTSYGAGGGGAGGDSSSYFDPSGGCGEGGFAGERATGNLSLRYGSVTLTMTIGSAGIGSGGTYRGGNGANGFAKLIVDGVTYNYTSSGTRPI